MPETRAAKRIKLTHPSKHDALVKSEPQKPVKAQLARLNALSTDEFLKIHVPKNLRSFRSNKAPCTEYDLECYNVQTLPKADLEQCYALLIETSRADYAQSSRGWHPKRKKLEMMEENMRYFIVREKKDEAMKECDDTTCSSRAVSPRSSTSSRESGLEAVKQQKELDGFGFLSFQFDDDWTIRCDERIPVLYLYEIHLGKRLRGNGLGWHLMNLASHIAQTAEMHKVELSVFTSNVKAELFYRSLGFETDETSPVTVKKEKRYIETDWLVLSLDIKKLGQMSEK